MIKLSWRGDDKKREIFMRYDRKHLENSFGKSTYQIRKLNKKCNAYIMSDFIVQDNAGTQIHIIQLILTELPGYTFIYLINIPCSFQLMLSIFPKQNIYCLYVSVDFTTRLWAVYHIIYISFNRIL